MAPKTFHTPALLGVALLLNACGLIKTPSAPLPDVTVNVPPLTSPSETVVYEGSNVFQSFTLPGILSHVSVTGQATSAGLAGTRTFNLMLTTQRPDCPEVSGSLVCTNSRGGGEVIGTVTLSPGQSAAVNLSGSALDQAAHSGVGYLGLQFQNGPRSGPGDTLKLSNLRATLRASAAL